MLLDYSYYDYDYCCYYLLGSGNLRGWSWFEASLTPRPGPRPREGCRGVPGLSSTPAVCIGWCGPGSQLGCLCSPFAMARPPMTAHFWDPCIPFSCANFPRPLPLRGLKCPSQRTPWVFWKHTTICGLGPQARLQTPPSSRGCDLWRSCSRPLSPQGQG